MSKIDNYTVNFTHFSYFWAILPIFVGKRITDLNGFKKTHHENGQNSLKLLSVRALQKCHQFCSMVKFVENKIVILHYFQY
jgi:hypothetical protein